MAAITPANTTSFLRRAAGRILPRRDYVKFDGSVLPLPDRRWCGAQYKDDRFYIASAEREARRLIDDLRCTDESRVLDVGCGQGRLPIGVLRVLGRLRYLGVDVDRRSVEWCQRHIQRRHPAFRFEYLPVYNERYNKAGVPLDEDFRFSLAPRSIDVVYLHSIFTNMTEVDLRIYLREFARVLAGDGRLFFTSFVETGVPDVSINPRDYRVRCSGPLHVVRYNRDYLFALIAAAGYEVTDFRYQAEPDGQSAVYLVQNQCGHRARP